MVREFKSTQGMVHRGVPFCYKPNERPKEGNFTLVENAGINEHIFLSLFLLISFVGPTGLYVAITGS